MRSTRCLSAIAAVFFVFVAWMSGASVRAQCTVTAPDLNIKKGTTAFFSCTVNAKEAHYVVSQSLSPGIESIDSNSFRVYVMDDAGRAKFDAGDGIVCYGCPPTSAISTAWREIVMVSAGTNRVHVGIYCVGGPITNLHCDMRVGLRLDVLAADFRRSSSCVVNRPGGCRIITNGVHVCCLDGSTPTTFNQITASGLTAYYCECDGLTLPPTPFPTFSPTRAMPTPFPTANPTFFPTPYPTSSPSSGDDTAFAIVLVLGSLGGVWYCCVFIATTTFCLYTRCWKKGAASAKSAPKNNASTDNHNAVIIGPMPPPSQPRRSYGPRPPGTHTPTSRRSGRFSARSRTSSRRTTLTRAIEHQPHGHRCYDRAPVLVEVADAGTGLSQPPLAAVAYQHRS